MRAEFLSSREKKRAGIRAFVIGRIFLLRRCESLFGNSVHGKRFFANSRSDIVNELFRSNRYAFALRMCKQGFLFLRISCGTFLAVHVSVTCLIYLLINTELSRNIGSIFDSPLSWISPPPSLPPQKQEKIYTRFAFQVTQ